MEIVQNMLTEPYSVVQVRSSGAWAFKTSGERRLSQTR
jgi:hypothetical protein